MEGEGSQTVTVSSFDPAQRFVEDWCHKGTGIHIDFERDESVPLQEGRFLGRGITGDVYETTIGGISLAWKRITCRRKVDLNVRKEIEILKKLDHVHMIQLVSTYTHRRHLGILLYPVALCDLRTFLEDAEAYHTNEADETQIARLSALDYFNVPDPSYKALPIYTQIGCLVSAIAYLHSQRIRHKDLKPSNILLSYKNLYLSDFGTATDFSLASSSATDHGGGTPRYFAPEVAGYQKSGRAADMFSLGCILLEVLVLQYDGSLKRLRDRNPAYHANLDRLNTWLLPEHMSNLPLRDYHLIRAIRGMLSINPEERPKSDHLLGEISLSDKIARSEPYSMFGSCCQISSVSASVHHEAMNVLNENLGKIMAEHIALKRSFSELDQAHTLSRAEKEQTEVFLEQLQMVLQDEEMARQNAETEVAQMRSQIEHLKQKLSQYEVPLLQSQSGLGQHLARARVQTQSPLTSLSVNILGSVPGTQNYVPMADANGNGQSQNHITTRPQPAADQSDSDIVPLLPSTSSAPARAQTPNPWASNGPSLSRLSSADVPSRATVRPASTPSMVRARTVLTPDDTRARARELLAAREQALGLSGSSEAVYPNPSFVDPVVGGYHRLQSDQSEPPSPQ